MSELNITATPLDGTWNLVSGTCKRIVFSFPFTAYNDLVQFSVQNLDFNNGKFVHWCGFNIRKVH